MKKKKMKMMMSEHKDPGSNTLPQLDSEQSKNEEEEEKSHRASLFKLFPCLFSKEGKKIARREERKLLNSRTWLDSD